MSFNLKASIPVSLSPTRTSVLAIINSADLHDFLICIARSEQTVAYGDVGNAFDHSWTQGFGCSLRKALHLLSAVTSTHRVVREKFSKLHPLLSPQAITMCVSRDVFGYAMGPVPFGVRLKVYSSE